MPRLTLDLITATLEEGRKRGFQPLSVVVLDAGGHVVAFQRENGASVGRFQIALGKAGGALFLGVSSRKIAAMAAERPSFVASLGTLPTSGVVPAPGGLILVDAEAHPIGAIGVTGDTSDNDETCALAAIDAVGLRARI
jgi:uncharacterized protein GlcG (DUF336 family)